jgi:hypothetical protein
MLAFQALSMCHANGLAMIETCGVARIDPQKFHHLLEEGRATPHAMEHRPRWYAIAHFFLR